MINPLGTPPEPIGQLALQIAPMPKDTNAYSDMSGGWLVSKMDMAGSIAATKISQGRVVTVAVDRMNFMIPVQVGNIVSFYTDITKIGHSSIQVEVEVWMQSAIESEVIKVTEGLFVFVALDDQGRTRTINHATK